MMLGCLALAPLAQAGTCPEPRDTLTAPADYLARHNPLSPERRHLRAARELYRNAVASPVSCGGCHGRKGDGHGQLATQFEPAPRNFRCAETMRDIPDGQLFWIIRHGSPGSGMPAHATLTDEQVWQLVLYIRQFAD
jgi:mono/diheme cytochrome c family protein